MVVVDEIHEALVDTLVIGHVGQWCMNPHRFADDLGQRAASPHKSVVGFAGTDLVTGEDAILEAS